MPILVTGMHRSGTSAVTQALAKLGCPLGPESELMTASASNSDGHFEALPVVEINDQVLALMGSSWAAPTHARNASAALAAGPMGSTARSYLKSRDDLDVALIKDPRFSVTLPFWRKCIDQDTLRIVLMIRHPTDVASSLAARNKFPLPFGRLLWRRYNGHLLGSIDGLQVVPVSYASLLSDPKATIEQIAGELGIPASSSKLERAALTVDTAARHHHTDEHHTADLSVEEMKMWETLRSLRSGPQRAIDMTPDSNDNSADETFAMVAELASSLDAERSSAANSTEEEPASADSQSSAESLEEAERRHRHEQNETRRGFEQALQDVGAERDLERARVVETSHQLGRLEGLLEGALNQVAQSAKSAGQAEQAMQDHQRQREAESAALRSEVSDLNTELSDTSRRLERERDVARHALELTTQRLETERDQARTHATTLETERDQARDHVATLETEHDTARTHAATLETERDTARSATAAAISELDDARQHYAEARGVLEEERDEARAALGDTTIRLEGERDAARSGLEELKAEFATLQIALTNAEAIKERAVSEIADLRRNMQDRIAAASVIGDQHEIEQLTARVEDDERHREHLQRELEGARHELHVANESLHHTQRQLAVFETSRAGKSVVRYWKTRDKGRELFRRSEPDSESVDEPAPSTNNIDAVQPEQPHPEPPLPAPVHFPHQDEPVVSIVVPVHGQLDMTVACLRSLAAHTGHYSFEVIVVDDLSPDRSAEWLDSCDNVHLVRNPENLGYLRSTNAGAAVARGPLIQLLNNDTEVSPGWLDCLVDTIRRSDDIGAVGSKLVYPDGTLQEAGTIIWNDGSGWNFGRNGDTEDSQVNFVREVDYCSAASLLVRRDLWQQLGGFDERYVPAYYEDSDLCFGLRSLGYQTVYQPKSVVTHHEGVSHGTDESAGLKAYQMANREKFVEKWKSELASHHPSSSDPVLAAWRGAQQRVIVFDHEVPAEDMDSGSVRMTAILDLLVEMGYKVTFVPHNRYRREPYASILCDRGIHVAWGWIDWRELVRGQAPELAFVIASRPSVAAEVIPFVTEVAPNVPIAYDMVDFHGLRIERRSQILNTNDMRHSEAMVELEQAMVRAADLTIAVTEEEREMIHERVPDAQVTVLPNIHRSPVSTAPFETRNGVMFIGSFRHTPNRDAINWLVDEIMPGIWSNDPSITLHLVGSDIPEDFVDTSGANITNHGWVEDLSELFNTVRVSVAPLRFGAGIKGKVGDSLMRGVPVVTTTIGAEGFGPVAEILLISDTTDGIVGHVLALHKDRTGWQKRADQGLVAVQQYFGIEASRVALTRIASLADELRTYD